MTTLLQQVEGVRSGTVTPAELVEASLAAIEATQPALNAIVHVRADQAKAEARGALPEGLLHGVPVVVKDLFDVAGSPTTGCCAAYRRVPATDSAVVAALRAAGAIVVAKANQHELAAGATNQVSSFGPAHNPWDVERVTGGSSGGSGAAVAGGIATLAMGSDTGGSIRIPSSFCGLTGLKPTLGAVPLDGAMSMSARLDTGGPMAWTAADCALAFGVLTGRPATAVAGDLSGVRVGLPAGWRILVDAETLEAVHAAAASLEKLGAVLVDVDVAETPVLESFNFVWAEMAETYPELVGADGVNPPIAALLQIGAALEPALRERSLAASAAIAAAVHDAMASVDVLLAPTTPMPAPRADEQEVAVVGGKVDVHAGGPVRFTAPINHAGLPALALPVGASSEGLPLSAQVVGRAGDDQRLLEMGMAYQAATDWHERRPPGYL